MTASALAALAWAALVPMISGRLALFMGGLVLAYLWARSNATERAARGVNATVLALALVLAAWFVATQASVVDDAFISFRYAGHLLRGDGLVFNPGERVEGITNILWTLVVAAGTWATGFELPAVALVLDLAGFVGCVGATAWLSGWFQTWKGGGEAGRGESPRHAPLALAPVLVALQYRMTASATTGLETGPVAFLVVAAAVCLALGTRRGRVGAGFLLLAGTGMHPDLLLGWGAGAVACWVSAQSGTRWRAAIEFGATLPIYFAATAARVAYYGDFFPNTYHAKSADVPYYTQGLAYAGSFLLGSYLWVAVLVAGWAIFRVVRAREGSVLHAFFALFVLAKTAYVVRLGGDFMDGRLFVDLVPPVLLLAEDGVRRASPRVSLWLFAALFATVRGTCLIPPHQVAGYLSDENSLYPLASLDPVTVAHRSSVAGQFLHRVLVERGIRPVVYSGGIGQLGYYSDLPLIDQHGLTDRVVALGPSPPTRGYPGHEKVATHGYQLKRKVRLVQSTSECRGPHAEFRKLVFVGIAQTDWCLLVYDRALMDEIAARAPEIQFMAFEPWLDRYIAGLPTADPETLKADWPWLKAYYFDVSHDRVRRSRIRLYL